VIETISLTSGKVTHVTASDANLTGGSQSGTATIADGVITVSDMSQYAAHQFLITNSASIYFDVTATKSDGADGNITLWFMNSQVSGQLGSLEHKEVQIPLNAKTTVELSIESFLHNDKFTGFVVGVFSEGEYTLEFDKIKISKGTTSKINLSESNITYGYGTGGTNITGCQQSGGINFGSGSFTITSPSIYTVHKIAFNTDIIIPDGTINDETYSLNNGASINNTIFNGDVCIEDGGVLYYGAGKSALSFSVENDNLIIDTGDYTCSNANVCATYAASDFGLETFESESFNLKIAVADVSQDGSSATIGIWINNIILGGNYFTITSDDGIGLDNTLTLNTFNVIAQVATLGMPEVPIVEPKNITWKDFGVSRGSVYTAENLWATSSYTVADNLDNTVFEGDIIFTENSGIRYGGSDGSFGLHLYVTEGKLKLSSDTFYLNDLSIAACEPTDFKLSTFDGEKITLKIAMSNVTANSATVGLWVNGMVVDEAFTMVSKSTGSYTLGNKFCLFDGYFSSGSGAVTIPEPDVTKISWADFDGAVYGKTYSSYEAVTYTDATSMDYTLFEDEVQFVANSCMRYGTSMGWDGLSIGVNTDGDLYFSNAGIMNIAHTDGSAFAGTYSASMFGYETLSGESVKLSVLMRNATETSASVMVWIDDIPVCEEFTIKIHDAHVGTYSFGNVIGIMTEGDGSITIPKSVPVPTGLTDLTWEDFGITCIGQYTTGTYGSLAGKELNDSLFNGDITMQADSHLRYGGSSGDFGLHVQVNSTGTLSLRSDTCTLNLSTTEFYPEMYGLKSFADNPFNLKIAVTELEDMTAKVGVWVNDRVLGDYFTLTCTGAYDSSLGNHIALHSGTMEPHSTLAKPTGLTDIKLGDWQADIYDDGVFKWNEIENANHPTVDTLVGTSFKETITFTGPTNSTDEILLYYGGMKSQSDTAYGLRIALKEEDSNDVMRLYGHGIDGFNGFTLTEELAGVSFIDTEFFWQIDVTRRGNHVLLYMYFNDKLYGGAPFVINDFAEEMNDSIGLYSFYYGGENPIERTPLIPIKEQTLSALYCDLDSTTYKIPDEIDSVKRIVITDGVRTEETMNVVAGDVLDQAGDYLIIYSDGVSMYRQEVVLYHEGDTKIGDDGETGASDLVRLIKYAKGETVTAYKSEEKAYDVNGDYEVDSSTDTMANKEVVALRQMILDTYVEDTSKVMPIVGHFGPLDELINDEIFSKIKKVGINQITQYQNQFSDNPAARYDVYEQLTLAQKYGMKITVKDQRLSADPSSATTEKVETYVKDYSYYQSFAGLYISDEPKTSNYPPNYTFGDTDERLESFAPLAKAARDTGNFGYANAMGYSDSYTKRQTREYLYVNYLETFVNEYKAPFLSHTSYPFWESYREVDSAAVGGTVENAEAYFKNLSMVRYVAGEKNIPFWTFVQSGDGFELTPKADNPSEGEFKWNANMGLAFGAKGIQYFPLVQPENFQNLDGKVSSGLLSADGVETTWYAYAQKVNKQISAIDHILMDATNVGIMATGEYAVSQAANTVEEINLYDSILSWIAAGEASTPVHSSYNGATVTVEEGNAYGAVTGCFEYGDKHALYIVNYNVYGEDTDKVTVDFGSTNTTATTIHNALTETKTGTSMSFELAPGEAVLVVY